MGMFGEPLQDFVLIGKNGLRTAYSFFFILVHQTDAMLFVLPTHSHVDTCVIDVDQGLGLVKFRPNQDPLPPELYDQPRLDYHKHLDKDRQRILSLKTVKVRLTIFLLWAMGFGT